MFLGKPLNTCVTASLTAALLFVWSGAPYAQTVTDIQDQQAAIFADQIAASLLALEDGDRDAPRDHWDPQYVVDDVGIEAVDLYAWVRAKVAFVPYQGALRGPAGVLMDRVGNSLDQSLLLAALLADAGYPVRLARADLSPDMVGRLWDQMAADRTGAGEDVSAADAADGGTENPSLLETADLYGVDPVKVGEVIDASNADAAQVFVALAPSVTDATSALSGILGPFSPETPAAAVVDEASAALADHWWVEYQDNGTWVGLDLMAADATSGAMVPAAETYDPAELPGGFEQVVIVKVIAEQWKDGALRPQVVLEQSIRPRDLLGTTIGFRHFPMAWPEDWPQMTPDDVQIKLRAALYAQTEWLPVLTLGDAVLGSSGILDSGELDPNPHPVNPFMQMTTAMIGMVSKATDVLETGGDTEQLLAVDPDLDVPRPPRAEGELVSERLEFTISRPGIAPIVTSRDIFDLIGAQARAKGDVSGFMMSGQKALDRSMAMLGESEIQILGSKLDPDFLIHLGAQSALANRPVLDELSSDPFGKLPSNYMELFSKLTGLPYALYGLATLRFSLNAYSDWVYVDRPMIVLQHTRLRRVGGGDFLAGISLDIVENGVGVDPFASDNAVALRMSQGVADTFAEAAALQHVGTVQPNVASVFSASDQQGAGWVALRPDQQALVPALGWDDEAKARIVAELASGNLVVLPAIPSAEAQLAGWWRVDPSTGQTLGISATGHGQAMVEYALIIIIETMMAAAQCALEASLTKALEKTLAEKAAGADSGKATGAGVKAGFDQAKKDVSNASLRNRCMAMGMFAGFKSLLLGFAMHAVKTSGNKGYDGSKPSNSWERNAVNNARNGSSTSGRSGTPTLPGLGPGGRSGTPTLPGVAPQAGGPRGTPTLPGVAPQAGGPRGNPTLPGVAPQAGGPRGNPTQPGLGPKGPTAEESAPTQRSPNAQDGGTTKRAPNADEMADTQRAPNGQPLSPVDRYRAAADAQAAAESKLAAHPPVNTPEGRAEVDKLWNDVSAAGRERARAYDALPADQRGLDLPNLPAPKAGPGGSGSGPGASSAGSNPPAGDFSGYKTGEGPPSQVPNTQSASATEPSADSLLNGLNGSSAQGTGRLPPANSDPSVDSLLNGLGGGKSAGSAGAAPGLGTAPTQPGASPFAPTQPGASPFAPTQPVPLPPPVSTKIGLQPAGPLTEAQATRASGLAGLAGALEPVAKP